MLKPFPDHGVLVLRNFNFAESFASTRSEISRPRVITATENSGWPIIGRIATRSRNNPIKAAKKRAAINDSPQAIHDGNPRS